MSSFISDERKRITDALASLTSTTAFYNSIKILVFMITNLISVAACKLGNSLKYAGVSPKWFTYFATLVFLTIIKAGISKYVLLTQLCTSFGLSVSSFHNFFTRSNSRKFCRVGQRLANDSSGFRNRLNSVNMKKIQNTRWRG